MEYCRTRTAMRTLLDEQRLLTFDKLALLSCNFYLGCCGGYMYTLPSGSCTVKISKIGDPYTYVSIIVNFFFETL